jgi:hypothetical protein
VANNYKTDTGKAPVVSAIFIPFGRTLLALAEMMERQKIRHKLQGAKDPFQEWRQLPEGKDRLVNAGGRHSLDPWTPNAKDRVGDHPGDLHILHAIWGLMAAHEKHLEELDQAKSAKGREAVIARELAEHRAALFPADPCCDAPDAVSLGRKDALEERAKVELWLQGERQAGCQCVNGTCEYCTGGGRTPIHGPAGADWREKHPPGQAGVELAASECSACHHPKALHDLGWCMVRGCECGCRR